MKVKDLKKSAKDAQCQRPVNALLDDDDDFMPCSQCDGHDACRDFGCAFELGLGHLVDDDAL